MQLGPLGWEVDPNLHLVVRVRGVVFAAPRAADDADGVRLVAQAEGGAPDVLDLDDLLETRLEAPPHVAGDPPTTVCVRAARGTYALAEGRMSELAPRAAGAGPPPRPRRRSGTTSEMSSKRWVTEMRSSTSAKRSCAESILLMGKGEVNLNFYKIIIRIIINK